MKIHVIIKQRVNIGIQTEGSDGGEGTIKGIDLLFTVHNYKG